MGLAIWSKRKEWIPSHSEGTLSTNGVDCVFIAAYGYSKKMPNLPSHCTQIDITSTDNPTDTTVPQQKNTSSQSEVVAVLKEILATQKKSCDLLSDVLKHVSFQHY